MRWDHIRIVDLLWNLLLCLTAIFTAAKIVGWIDWPWWAVLSPFVVPLSVLWLVFVTLFIFWFVVLVYHRLRKRK